VDSGWKGAENRASTGIRFPDVSARNESLYRKSVFEVQVSLKYDKSNAHFT